MKNLYKYGFFIFFLLLLSANSCSNQGGFASQSVKDLVNLDKGWQYRVGDSPINEKGFLVWLDENWDAPGWNTVYDINDFCIKNTSKSLWLRIQLPEWEEKNAGIYINGVSQQVQVYLDHELIYQFGNFKSLGEDHFYGWRQHPIQLPPNVSNKMLTLRIWSNGQYTGIVEPVILAPMFDIIESLFYQNIDELLLAGLFVILGAAVLIMFVFFQHTRLFLGISMFLLSMGFFTASNSLYLQYMVNAPHLFFMFDLFSLLAAPIGIMLIIEPLVLQKYGKIVKLFRQFAVLYWISILFMVQIFPKINLDIVYNFFFLMVTFFVLNSTFFIYKSLKKGGKQVKILFVGVLLALLAYSIETIIYYTSQRVVLTSYNMSFIPVGVLCFVGCLTWIIVQQYVETYQQKEAAFKSVMESKLQRERMKDEIKLKILETEKWQELNHIKSQFFANISHEFRTPLTLVLGTAKQLYKETNDPGIQEKYKIQIRNSNRLLCLVNQLLELSKIESGKTKINVQKLDIVPMIKGICQCFEHQLKLEDIKLKCNSGVESIFIYYDPVMMEKIIMNVISNAVKFTNPSGQVTVDIIQKEVLEIQVRDTGPGISQEHLPHIFDRFYQTGNNYERDPHGSGIGLALTRELVLLHHGEIKAASIVGVGTTITIQLLWGCDHFKDKEIVKTDNNKSVQEYSKVVNEIEPLLFNDKMMTETPNKEINSGYETDTHLSILLIVEDNIDMCNYIRNIFQNEYKILNAMDGKTGFFLAVEYVPDLIISDVMMPEMDGFELCDKIKADVRTSHIPFILLTARSNSESKLEGLQLGADDFLIKPFEEAELLTRSRNLIEQRRKLRERFSKDFNIPFNDLSTNLSDEKFLQRAVEIIEANLENTNFTVELYCHEIGFSRSQLHRKLQALTGQSTSSFIRSIRLKRAVQMLVQKSNTVSEIAYATGFSSADYFRHCFKEYFGLTPTDYISQ